MDLVDVKSVEFFADSSQGRIHWKGMENNLWPGLYAAVSRVLRAGGIPLHNATTIKQRAITTL